jgi:sulfate adenylyltransferase subunit 1 (EFTu-like GTPase family)
MDLMGFERQVFTELAEEVRAVTERLGITDILTVPIAAFTGDNVAEPARLSWSAGPTLVEAPDATAPASRQSALGLPVQLVIRASDNRVLAGTVMAGHLHVGDLVDVLPMVSTAGVKDVFGASGAVGKAMQERRYTRRLEPDSDTTRGDLIVAHGDSLRPADRFAADLVWSRTADNRPKGAGCRVWSGRATSRWREAGHAGCCMAPSRWHRR